MVVKDKVLGVICLEKNLEIQDCFAKSDLELLVTLANSAAIAIDNANLYKDLLNIYFETIQSLAAAIEAKDAYTHGHSRRVTDFAMATAKKMGCDEITLKTIWHSALLHDIGKIGINESILLKPGKLTNDEFAHIQSHPILGSKILESIDFLANVRAQLKYHHERWDGKGYPDKLKGTAIPFGARIIAVADTFDAMTSTRPYRKALSLAEAKNEIIRCSGSQFDPSVVEAFLKIPEKELQQIIDFKNIQSANEKPVIYETFEKAGVS
jgi:putative nucleotidyltransferase with HDIG domain